MSPQISGMTSTPFCPRNIDRYCRCKVDVFYKVLPIFIVRLPQCLNNTSKFAILNAAEKCNTSSGMLPPISLAVWEHRRKATSPAGCLDRTMSSKLRGSVLWGSNAASHGFPVLSAT